MGRIGFGMAQESRMDAKAIMRFMRYVKPDPNECWIWQGYKDHKGYGQFRYGNRSHWAHRLSYVLFNGPIPDGWDVHHKRACGCSSCVNPDHLEIATRTENSREGVQYRERKRIESRSPASSNNVHATANGRAAGWAGDCECDVPF